MAFFGTPTVEQPSEEEMLGLLQMPKTQGGILGFLRNPAVSAALGGMSRGFTQAAAAGTPAGLGLATGLAGGAQAFGAWEEAQAKAAAERVNQIAQARRGETDYRYQLGLIAKRLMRDEGMDEESAYIAAQQEMAGRPFEQRGALMDKQHSNEIAREFIKDQIAKGQMSYEMGMRLAQEPDIAAAIEKAKAGATREFELEVGAESADTAVGILSGLESALSGLPSPARIRLEGAKAFFGIGDGQILAKLGQARALSGQMIGYVQKLPGAATDREFPYFMASAGVVADDNEPKEVRLAAAQEAKKYFENIVRRQEKRKATRDGMKPGATTTPDATPAGKTMRWNPQTGRVE